MNEEHVHMHSIWYFVGLLLLIMGALVCGGGLINLLHPSARTTVLGHLRPAIWWGMVMMVSGILFLLNERRGRKKA